MEQQIRIVVSLTSSPKRLPFLNETLDSIIVQNVKPEKIYVNLPPTFKRTNESYPDPTTLFKDKPEYKDVVVWNRNCEDLGPVTKLQGSLNEINENEDVWIVTIDDDIKYMQYTIELYYATILKFNSTKTIAYGLSGFFWMEDYSIRAQYENSLAHILEGYGSVCYHRSYFPKSWNTYLNKCLENNSCKFSDDVVISNWIALRKIQRLVISSPWTNRRLMWNNGSILDHGNDKDALHNGGATNVIHDTNVNRYANVKNHLSKIKLLSPEFEWKDGINALLTITPIKPAKDV
jgi:hypothetical protein